MFDIGSVIERAQKVPLLFPGVTSSTVLGNRRTRIPGSGVDDFAHFTEFDPMDHHPRLIDWALTSSQSEDEHGNEVIIAKQFNESREIKVWTIINVTGLGFQSEWCSMGEQAAYVAGSIIASAAKMHDPAGLIIINDEEVVREERPAPTSKMLEPAVELIAASAAAHTDRIGGGSYAGLEESIQRLPRSPALVFLVLPLWEEPKSPELRQARQQAWQVVGGARDAGHDVRCILVVDPRQENLPDGFSFYRLSETSSILTTRRNRRRWHERFQKALQSQQALFRTFNVPWCVVRTSDEDGRSLDFLTEVAQGF